MPGVSQRSRASQRPTAWESSNEAVRPLFHLGQAHLRRLLCPSAEDQQLVHDFRDACRECGASVSFMVRSLIHEWLEARRSQGVEDV